MLATGLGTFKSFYAAFAGPQAAHGGVFALLATGLALLPGIAPAAEFVVPAPVAEKVDRQFTDAMASKHWPGAIWAVVADGRIVHLGAAGVADLETGRKIDGDTIFRIASMSKAFTALAILKLRDEGKLSLDATAATYIPEMKAWRYPTTDSPRIRVRDLLSHVAGFVTDDPWGDRQQDMSEQDFTRLLQQGVAFSHAPAMEYEYSNLGYALLGRIITHVSGRPYDEYIMATIMKPLGMTSTGYDIFAAPQDRRAFGYRWEEGRFVAEPTLGRGVFGAMGGAWTTANDYAKWVTFLLQAWPARDGPEVGPVRRSTLRELAQGLDFPQLMKSGVSDQDCVSAGAYGKGFFVIEDCVLGLDLAHSGGYPGYGSNVRLLVEKGVASFVFTNRTYGGPSTANRLALIELEKSGLLADRPQAVSAALASAYDVMKAIWRDSSLRPAEGYLAMNVTLDKSVALRERELAELRGKLGQCETIAPIVATGALNGTFTWRCEKGAIKGEVLLAPTARPQIQSYEFDGEAAGP